MWYLVSPYLAHHGVKGQRWGVRRYQNKDGSLTVQGRDHYNVGKKRISKYQYEDGSLTPEGKELETKVKNEAHLVYNTGKGKERDEMVQIEKDEIGIKSVDDDTDLIPEGVKFQRIIFKENEPLDDKRKYVTVLDSDNRSYFWQYGYDQAEEGSHVNVVEYESSKDMKVATFKKTHEELMKFIGDKNASDYITSYANEFQDKIAKDILSKYGNVKLKDIDYDPITEKMLRYDKVSYGSPESGYNKDHWLNTRFSILTKSVAYGSNAVVISLDDEYKFQEHMKQLGYDAIIDPHDGRPGEGTYPLVILDPQSSVKQVNKYSVLGDNAGPVKNEKRR